MSAISFTVSVATELAKMYPARSFATATKVLKVL